MLCFSHISFNWRAIEKNKNVLNFYNMETNIFVFLILKSSYKVTKYHCIDFTFSFSQVCIHPWLTRVRGIRFLQFEIILVYILTIFKVTDLLVKYFLFKTYMPAKKYLKKKAEKLCLIGVFLIESYSFLEYWLIFNEYLIKWLNVLKNKNALNRLRKYLVNSKLSYRKMTYDKIILSLIR